MYNEWCLGLAWEGKLLLAPIIQQHTCAPLCLTGRYGLYARITRSRAETRSGSIVRGHNRLLCYPGLSMLPTHRPVDVFQIAAAFIRTSRFMGLPFFF